MLPSNIPEFETGHPVAKRSRPAVGGLVITVVLALALVAVIAVAVTRMTGGSLTRPTAATAPTQVASTSATAAPAPGAATGSQSQSSAAAGTPADAATSQAIQEVIQKVDQAQIQAIASNDPNVMAPTATPEFYQEQVAANQDLVNSGVTEIKLVKMEWGPITADSNTATATVWETWSTTFQDGTTEQSRDRNVYTLILDNGTWKVSADDHPDQQPTGIVQNPTSTP